MFRTIKSKIFMIVALMIPMIMVSGFYFYKKTNDIYKNEYLGLKEASEGVKLSRSFEKNIIQIQQWLTDVSATRGAKGFDDGHSEAKKYFDLALGDLKELKNGHWVNESDHSEMMNLTTNFYETGKHMAALYIKGGPAAGNSYMETFDKESEKLQSKMDPLIEQLRKREKELFEKSDKSLKGITRTVFVVFIIILFYISTCLLLLGKSVISALGKVTSTIKVSSEKLKIESEAVNHSSVMLSEASTEQASSLQETVSSIDEISSMVQRNADAANNSAQVSKKSTEAASRGKKTVESMISSIRDISESNETIMAEIKESNSEISKIVTMISEIGEKTKIINDIVFQTKLLSFNASVEAARAGEHGKGFAVVAEEVGNLASMSGKAALEITEMLDRSTKKVTSIIEQTKGNIEALMKKGKEKVELGAKTAEECGESLDEILQNVSSVNEMIREISTASSEQASGVKEVTKAMQELDKTTHQNSSIANKSSVMARNLLEQSTLLNSAVADLAIVVGESKKINKEEIKEELNNILDLETNKIGKIKSEKSVKKGLKVSGSEVEIPDEFDSRFEDL